MNEDLHFLNIQINFCSFAKMVKTWELFEDMCYKRKTSKPYISKDLSIPVFKRFLKYWTVKNLPGHGEISERSLWTVEKTSSNLIHDLNERF